MFLVIPFHIAKQVKQNSTKTISYYSFVNNNVKIIRYQGINPNCDTNRLLEWYKNGFDNVKKKEVDKTFRVFDKFDSCS